MRFQTLDEWLRWQETLHPSEIELGLERIKQVQSRLDLLTPSFCVITIAGTNGKGSCAAMLQSIYSAAGYRVGLYTSPHIKRYNERILVNGQTVSDEDLCYSFERIDRGRGDISLTYFEFGTLAAIDIFVSSNVDIVILEVGLGGRLDAVNILDADVALVTTIGLDHQDWLGTTREQIAAEKIAIARANRPVICGDDDPPQNLIDYAAQLPAELFRLHKDFNYSRENDISWCWYGPGNTRCGLPIPAMRGEVQLKNASCVLMVIQVLQGRFPVSQADIRLGILNGILAGRFQVLAGPGAMLITDVAHNPQAAQALASTIMETKTAGKIYGVFAVLRDKDIAGIMLAMDCVVDTWLVADLPVKRGASASEVEKIALNAGITKPVKPYSSVNLAKEAALLMAKEEDCIVIFGSFYTVAEVL